MLLTCWAQERRFWLWNPIILQLSNYSKTLSKRIIYALFSQPVVGLVLHPWTSLEVFRPRTSNLPTHGKKSRGSPCYCIFTVLHGMQTRSSNENSVRLSFCPFVTRVNCDKTVERSVKIYIPCERTFSQFFWEEEGLWGRPFYLKFWVNRPPLKQNRQFWTDNRSQRLSRNT